ncbi:hypothetical protein [Deinococcus frigens]|uniref:hypothetical protein n=1 Tax=Deinococcus frigens TaxID=249403 RepID=UPI00068DF37F|nr:hypothetical protein [Deinococcus frigens]
MTFEEYTLDAMRSSAVERQLGIVGEAVAQVLKLEPDAPLGAARQIGAPVGARTTPMDSGVPQTSRYGAL